MKVAVLGAGAMGGLFGGYLSRKYEVTVVDVNERVVQTINAEGLTIEEPDGSRAVYHPVATASTRGMAPVDLVIVFVKAMFTEAALHGNRDLIGPDTYLMTLQNGSGHEEMLGKFVDQAHIIIGTTQHNASVLGMGITRHGGSGITHMGCIEGDVCRLQRFADAFSACGLETEVSDGVQRMIWQKMFTNVSASVLTGVLQVPLGYIAENAYAWAICSQLIREAVDVAAGIGLRFDYEEKRKEVRDVCTNAPEGLTSIYMDIKQGRRTEVDTISGSIVRASQRCGVPAPAHEMMVRLVHAMEGRVK